LAIICCGGRLFSSGRNWVKSCEEKKAKGDFISFEKERGRKGEKESYR